MTGSGHAVLERGAYKAPTVCTSLCRGWSPVFTTLGMGKALPQAGEKWPAPGSQHLGPGLPPAPRHSCSPHGNSRHVGAAASGSQHRLSGSWGSFVLAEQRPCPWACSGGQVLAHPQGTPPHCVTPEPSSPCRQMAALDARGHRFFEAADPLRSGVGAGTDGGSPLSCLRTKGPRARARPLSCSPHPPRPSLASAFSSCSS